MSSVALIEDGILNEFYIEYKGAERLTGNIYKGKVETILQGMETAFVNIGRNRNGFLFVGETLDDRQDLSSSGAIPKKLNIKEGDYVMVQVTKEEVGNKGARLSMNLSIPGRYVVFLPNIDFVGISNKIVDPDKRDKLIKLLEKNKTQGGGLIARTACLNAKRSDILAEIKRMKAEYENLAKKYELSSGISLIQSEGGLIYRTIRDVLSEKIESIVCNNKTLANSLVSRFRDMKSDFANKVTYYDGKRDIWDEFGIIDEIDKLLQRKVDLPSGGSLIIDRTEALTSIDVNTARYVGDTTNSHEDTVYKTNMEAAHEIARQLRLRNIGGIIVVDFIDMLEDYHKQTVVEKLRAEVLNDRTKTRVLNMTTLGLVEVTRKKVGNEISTVLSKQCDHCKSNGTLPSNNYVARKLKAALKNAFADYDASNAIVTINADSAEYMITSGYFSPLIETVWRNKRIYLIPLRNVNPLTFKIVVNNDNSLSLPPNAKLLY